MKNEKFNILSRKVTRRAYLMIGSDSDPGRQLQNEISGRDRYYTDLLKNYTSITKFRNYAKEAHKWIFFWAVMVTSGFGVVFIGKILNKILSIEDIQTIVEAIPLIVTALVSFISTVIVVPTTISKFLFNTSEDDNITKLIQHTQEHDASAIQFLKERFLLNPNNTTEEGTNDNSNSIIDTEVSITSDTEIDSDN